MAMSDLRFVLFLTHISISGECLQDHLNSRSVHIVLFVCLFVLTLNVPVNNFSVMSRRSHRFLGIISTFGGVNVSLLKETTRRR